MIRCGAQPKYSVEIIDEAQHHEKVVHFAEGDLLSRPVLLRTHLVWERTRMDELCYPIFAALPWSFVLTPIDVKR